ncbi:MAG: hypothetical protein K0S26_709 [Bacteroidota bacterium]|nr:hypothetical protein [Bacteroidota bacterium]
MVLFTTKVYPLKPRFIIKSSKHDLRVPALCLSSLKCIFLLHKKTFVFLLSSVGCGLADKFYEYLQIKLLFSLA